jgi:hypothetical protein
LFAPAATDYDAVMPLQITLDDRVSAAAESQAAASGFDTVDSYVSNLIEADAGVPISAALEAELLKGLAGPSREMTAADWESKKQVLRAKFARTDGA